MSQDTILGEEFKLALDSQKLTVAERKGSHQRVRRRFSSAQQLIKKCPFSSNSLVEALRCLDPRERKRAINLSDMDVLPREILVGVIFDDVRSEWIWLQAESSVESTPSQVDHYWHQIFSIMDAFGGQKCMLLSKVVKAALTLSYSSTDVKRFFLSKVVKAALTLSYSSTDVKRFFFVEGCKSCVDIILQQY